MGDALTTAASNTMYGYVTAPNVLDEQSANQFSKMLASVLNLRQGAVPILSNEGWVPRSEIFRKTRLLEKAGAKALVVLYIRPPLEWLNSAWWQWGAWSGHELGHWIDRSLGNVRWNTIARRWLNVPGVVDVAVRLATLDVVADFGRLIGSELEQVGRSNAGNDRVLLRLMQKYSELRPGPHDSIIDFVMARWAPASERTVPWVIPSEKTHHVLATLREDNEQLLELVPAETAENIRSDPRWWAAEAYEAKVIEPAEATPLSVEDAEEIAVRAIRGLMAAARGKKDNFHN